METSASPQTPVDIIVVEDNPGDFDLLALRMRSYDRNARLTRVETREQLRAALASLSCAAVISDHQLPNFSSLEALALVRAFDADLPFVIVSGTIGQELAVAAMRAGADDYIMKDDLSRLTPTLQRAVAGAAARRRQRAAEAALVESEARFRALARNLPGVVFQLQSAASQLGLAYVNDGVERLFGIAPARIMASPQLLFDLVAPDATDDLGAVLERERDSWAPVGWVRRIEPRPDVVAEWIEFAARPRALASGETIWDCVVYDVTPQKKSEHDLRQSRQELRDLAMHLTRVREEEREAIARDIHDDVGSTLNAVKFDLAWLKTQVPDNAAIGAKLRQTDQLVDGAIHSSTRIMHDLRPGILDEGIVASLEWQARSFEQRMGIACVFSTSHDEIPLDRDCAIALFRICQESLNNISKHARADTAHVSLTATTGRLDMEVRDNGLGVSADDMRKIDRFGLRGMRERALSLGGELRVNGKQGHGTVISVWVPRPVTTGMAGAPNQVAPA